MTTHKSRWALWGAIATLAAGVIFAGPALASAIQFDYTSSIVNYTIPTTGLYTISAFGAEGAHEAEGGGHFGGQGAEARGDFNLTMGDMLRILVGGAGNNNGDDFDGDAGGGGGGGSFVAFVTGMDITPLVVAGGGGGGSYFQAGQPGQAGNNGSRTGGTSTGDHGAGGGGGFHGDGQSSGDGGLGGSSFVNGGIGGSGVDGSYGGFGGGGGGGGDFGGGGGGYNGGNANSGNANSGGGSFVADFAANPFTQTGGNTNNGFITFELISAGQNDVAEPSAVLLFALALLGVGVVVRARHS